MSTRPNTREPLGAHVSFECTESEAVIEVSESDLETLIMAFIVLARSKDLMCVPRGSLVFGFTSSHHPVYEQENLWVSE